MIKNGVMIKNEQIKWFLRLFLIYFIFICFEMNIIKNKIYIQWKSFQKREDHSSFLNHNEDILLYF